MKFGIRRPSIRKRIAARTSVKRAIRHNLGLKAPRGYGWITNPRKAAYNRIYNRTTRGCGTAALLALTGLVLLITQAACQLALSAAAVPTSSPQPPTASPTTPPSATLTPTLTATLTATAAPTGTPTPAPTGTPTATASGAPVVREDGFTVYTVAEDGYEIALPPDWQKIDVDPERWSEVVDKLSEQNPDYATSLGEQAKAFAAAGIKFYGADLSLDSIKSGFMTNINVIRAPAGLDVGLDVLVQLSINQLEQLESVVKPVRNQALTLPAGPAQKLSYKMKLTLPNNKVITAANTQYVFLKDQEMFVISISTRADQAAKYAGVFDTIAGSFQFLP